MTKKLIILTTVCLALAQYPLPAADAISGPVYDAAGRLIAYQYSDGTRDLYTYDATWRLVTFESRSGEITRYAYKNDGSMMTLKPDGTTVTSR